MSDSKEFQQWMFNEFYRIVEYKAKERGIEVVQVDPKNTSKKCSRCACIDDSNRCGGRFKCVDCGYMLHSDFNASKNIGYRYLRIFVVDG